jgi:virulence-associated protein VapD
MDVEQRMQQIIQVYNLLREMENEMKEKQEKDYNLIQQLLEQNRQLQEQNQLLMEQESSYATQFLGIKNQYAQLQEKNRQLIENVQEMKLDRNIQNCPLIAGILATGVKLKKSHRLSIAN